MDYILSPALVVKVPRTRADELAAHPPIAKLRMREREMREWIFVPVTAAEEWKSLLAEAYSHLDEITP